MILRTARAAGSTSRARAIIESLDAAITFEPPSYSALRRAMSFTHLKDIALRKALYEGGSKVIAASSDSMIALARLVDPAARAVRKIMDTDVDEVKRQAYAQIAGA